eukprot:CAMPEP_0177777590 /NCGR_PEP_ID=MMETSP0491_2-20121128/15453_1 /TAXON_ID=63592 /ORGANISM="Tetraselmis chuii, Strain PLY429" /LENGTH=355 /DNA_ID=CAMNT_0019296709 /DNA_START=329 /DNA_END=1393 /DNA_ORIENTATION=+
MAEGVISGTPAVRSTVDERGAMISAGTGRLRVGCAGFSNKAWVGDALPAGTRADGLSMLDAYQGLFDTVEVNSSFYGCPSVEQVARWASGCARGFQMGLKAPQDVTHAGGLAGDDPAALDRVTHFVQVASRLGNNLGPLLFQFPRSLEADMAILHGLDGVLLSRGCSSFRVALEFRHASWFHHPQVAAYCAERNWAIVQHPNSVGRATTRPNQGKSPPQRVPLAPLRDPEPPTANWAYVRLHGDNDQHSYDYSDEELAPYAATVAAWRAARRDVYVVFLNESGPPGCAMPKNAVRLKELVHALAGETVPRAPKAPRQTMLSFFQPKMKRQRVAREEKGTRDEDRGKGSGEEKCRS